MAEALSTVAAVVSFVDVTIRACKGVRAVVDTWKEASNTIQRIRQTVQNQQSMLECLRLYVVEYESSKLFVEQHQLLPLVVKNELRDTSSDLDLLLQLLPAAGGQRKMRHQLQWVFDEKKVLAVVSRLDSRQVAVMTGLHITAQRNVISIYNQISSIRNEMQQSHASSLSQLGEAKSSISQQIGEATRYGSDRISEQADMLRSIQTLVEPVAENHANTIDRLGDLVTSTHLSEGRLLSKMALGNISVDSLRRILRTEVPSLIMRIFEEYLNPNKSSQDAQPKGIRESLDRIVSDLGNPLLAGSTRNDVTDNEKPTAGSFQSELSHHSLPHHQTSITPLAKPSRADRRAFTNSHDAAQHWSRLWSRFWTFRWPIGVLRVHISTFHFKVSARRNEYQAYEQCVSSIGRYAYRVSIDFLVAPSLLVARGINLKCENKQDHRGFYQICPMVSTFAVIPLDAEAFSCVKCNDVAGLQSLFENRLAAPTDRTEDGFSLLHIASMCAVPDVCELLLTEGADPLATTSDGYDVLSFAILAGACTDPWHPSRKWAGNRNHELVTRRLVRSGCDLNEHLLSKMCAGFWTGHAAPWQRKWISEDPPDSLISWAKCLRDQGLNINQLDDLGRFTPFSFIMFVFHRPVPYNEQLMWELTHRAFMLCLLGADVSVRAPLGGLQALHILCGLGSWSAVLSNHFVDLACILIKFGNADVSAVTNDGWCPTGLAYWRGWKEEWKTALGLCGYDPEEVVRTAVERWQKHGSVGLGESTAVDVEDFVTSWSGISRRKNITGDRLTD